MVDLQVQRALDEMDYLDAFQYNSGQDKGWKQYWLHLVNFGGLGQSGATILALLDLSVAFDTINRGILLDWFWGLGVGGTALLHGQFQPVLVEGKNEIAGGGHQYADDTQIYFHQIEYAMAVVAEHSEAIRV